MPHRRLARIARWTARILGALIFGFAWLMFIGEGISEPPQLQTIPEILFALTFLVVVLVPLLGYIVAWRREGVGGGILLLGGLGLGVFVYTTSGVNKEIAAVVLSSPLLLLGLLFWLAARWSRAAPPMRRP